MDIIVSSIIRNRNNSLDKLNISDQDITENQAIVASILHETVAPHDNNALKLRNEAELDSVMISSVLQPTESFKRMQKDHERKQEIENKNKR